jgi:hypothetical protein
MKWSDDEVLHMDLGDPRRTRRLSQILASRSEAPSGSFNEHFSSPSELNKFYQFCDNPYVDREAILAGHREKTVARMADEEVVLAVQDSMEYDVTHHPEAQGFGALQGPGRQGAWLHNTLAVTPDRRPLGVLDQQCWYREAAAGKKADRHKRPTEEKESLKWLQSVRQTAAATESLSTRVVSVGDSEADIYDLFHCAKGVGQELLVRACQDRRVDETAHRLWSHLECQEVVQRLRIDVPRRQGQRARQAMLTVRYAPVQIKPPKARAREQLPTLQTWAVLAREANPPKGVKPLKWLLISTAPISTTEQACERLQWYSCRWVIETFHKVLKSGCRIEERQFGHATRVERYLAIDSIVAWRVLLLTMQGRTQPGLSAELVLEPVEWRALCCYTHRLPTPPDTPPTLGEVVKWIAKLGGYLDRKSSGPPGVTVIWRGMQQLPPIVDMYQVFQNDPSSRHEP